MDYLGSLAGTFGSDDDEDKADLSPYQGDDADICESCGWSNRPHELLCVRCRQRPHSSDAEGDDEQLGDLVLTPDFYQPLFQACHAAASGRLEPPEWDKERQKLISVLDSIARGLEQHFTTMRETQPGAQEASERLATRFQAAFAALDSMGAYLETPDPAILNQGWMDLIRATGGIQKSAGEFAELQKIAAEEEARKAEEEAAKKAKKKQGNAEKTNSPDS